MRNTKPKRFGIRQHSWMYGGPNCWKRVPFRFRSTTGQPSDVLENLIAQGMMWCERREARLWQPRKQEWSDPLPGADFWCGLTNKGLKAIEAIRDYNREVVDAQESKRAEV